MSVVAIVIPFTSSYTKNGVGFVPMLCTVNLYANAVGHSFGNPVKIGGFYVYENGLVGFISYVMMS